MKKSKSVKHEESKWLFRLKSLAIVLFLTAGLYANQQLSAEWLALKVLLWLFVIAVSLAIFFTTTLGQQLKVVLADASGEWHKIVWPSRQEAIQMSVVVTIVVCVASMLLWVIDGLFMQMIGQVL